MSPNGHAEIEMRERRRSTGSAGNCEPASTEGEAALDAAGVDADDVESM
jgi:hypothetical protein